MKGYLFYTPVHLLFAEFPSNLNSAAWAFHTSPALLSCYHPLIRSCLKLACESYRAELIILPLSWGLGTVLRGFEKIVKPIK